MNFGRIFPLTVALALGSCSPLLAGPIEWSYSTSISSASDSSINQVWVRNGGSGAGGTWILWVDFASQSPTSESGSASAPLGSALPRLGNAALDGPRTNDTNFRVTVALTDAASGQSGSVSFTGFFTAEDGDIYLPYPVTTHYTSPQEQSIVLGGNVYDVAFQNPPGQGGLLAADVSVSPLATPEPATAALFGIGSVFGLLGYRLRPRKAEAPPTAAA